MLKDLKNHASYDANKMEQPLNAQTKIVMYGCMASVLEELDTTWNVEIKKDQIQLIILTIMKIKSKMRKIKILNLGDLSIKESLLYIKTKVC